MLTSRELDILTVLWKSENPMTSFDISKANMDLSQSTVQAVLRKLLKENLIEVCGTVYSGKVLSRTYRPTEISKDWVQKTFVADYRRFCQILPQSTLFSAMLKIGDAPDTKQETISQLEKILEDYKKNSL